MKIRVKVLAGGVNEKSIDVEQGSTYYDVLACLKINPETVIIMVDGRPVPMDEMVSADYLEILRVVSGG
ncbi:MAG: MoaD/ThiS family protein [Methanosarcinales archaeon]|nr:MoaD/ThiS family protein [Methanosarcinales archaeon]